MRGALAERSWNSLTMLEVVEERRGADEADLAPALARLLEGAGKPDFMVSALPGELVVKRMLSLPFKDQRRLTQTVPFALEEHLPVGVDESVVAFTRVGQEDDKTLVMAAMVRKDDLRRHLELLARAGINPTTVTLSALALAALLARVRNGHGGAHLLVDLDQARPRWCCSTTTGCRGRLAPSSPRLGRGQWRSGAGGFGDPGRGAPDPARSQLRP